MICIIYAIAVFLLLSLQLIQKVSSNEIFSSKKCNAYDNDSFLIHARLAEHLNALGKYDEASAEYYCLCYSYDRSDQDLSSWSSDLFVAGRYLANQNHHNFAIKCIASYLYSNSDDIQAILFLTKLFIDQKDYIMGLELIQDAMSKDQSLQYNIIIADHLKTILNKINEPQLDTSKIEPIKESNYDCDAGETNNNSNDDEIVSEWNFNKSISSIVLNNNIFLDNDDVFDLAMNLKQSFKSNFPFPHIILDQFFSDELLHQLVLDFMTSNKPCDDRESYLHQHHKIQCDHDKSSIALSLLMNFMYSKTFLEFLENLTGIKNLLPDPMMHGGGTHEIRSEGYLKIHTDFEFQFGLHMWRRVNVFLYLNEDWNEDWGGELELWDENVKILGKKIIPIFNRMVIFESSYKSFHGHPDPLRTPTNVSRKSVALYYYTVLNENYIDSSRTPYATTSFKARPNEILN
eukprot:gene7274-9916_t